VKFYVTPFPFGQPNDMWIPFLSGPNKDDVLCLNRVAMIYDDSRSRIGGSNIDL
jgi:hypothetical protein